MKFKKHAGSLSESMKTVVEINDRQQLFNHIAGFIFLGAECDPKLIEDNITFHHVGMDKRNGWDTYNVVVNIEHGGVVGQADAPLSSIN